MPLSAKHPTAAIPEPFALSSRKRLALALSCQRERHLPTKCTQQSRTRTRSATQHAQHPLLGRHKLKHTKLGSDLRTRQGMGGADSTPCRYVTQAVTTGHSRRTLSRSACVCVCGLCGLVRPDLDCDLEEDVLIPACRNQEIVLSWPKKAADPRGMMRVTTCLRWRRQRGT